jgi:putative ABC transport system ATP-binding protein
VILADEPTGNLDSDSTQHLLSLLEASVADGVAMVVATHDPDVAARATRRLAVRDGRMETPRSP